MGRPIVDAGNCVTIPTVPAHRRHSVIFKADVRVRQDWARRKIIRFRGQSHSVSADVVEKLEICLLPKCVNIRVNSKIAFTYLTAFESKLKARTTCIGYLKS